MRTRPIAIVMLALAALPACSSIKRALGLGGNGGTGTTSVYGHWVLAGPTDSTAFVGATQVELVLAPTSFNLSATYPNRPQLAVDGRAELAEGGLLTLVPASGAADAASIGFPPGQPFTRIATASGATLVLASPNARVPLPSSVWHRRDVAGAAGLVP